jgi:hypothetical protein
VQLPGGRFVHEWRGLRVLTAAGSQIAETIPLVRRFVWSNDSDRLAYVVGRYRGLYEEDADQSVWIWSAADKRSRKIRDGAHHVSWARFDGNLYLLELVNGGARQVLRVNGATGSIEKTSRTFVVAWGASSKELIAQFEDDSVLVMRLSDFGPFC